MKITKRQLRRIIQEEIIREEETAALTADIDPADTMSKMDLRNWFKDHYTNFQTSDAMKEIPNAQVAALMDLMEELVAIAAANGNLKSKHQILQNYIQAVKKVPKKKGAEGGDTGTAEEEV